MSFLFTCAAVLVLSLISANEEFLMASQQHCSSRSLKSELLAETKKLDRDQKVLAGHNLIRRGKDTDLVLLQIADSSRIIGKDLDMVIDQLIGSDEAASSRASEGFAEKSVEAEVAISEMILRIGNRDELIRSRSSRALVKIGIPAVSKLIGALKDGNPQQRRVSATVLSTMQLDNHILDPLGDVVAVPLANALADDDVKVRSKVGMTLFSFHEKALPATDVLGQLLDHGDPSIRAQSAKILGG